MNSKKILILDSQPLVCEALKNIINTGFPETGIFHTGCSHHASKLVTEHKIDLVILDVIMPKKDGMETFKELKKLNKNVRVLVSTGYLPNNMSMRFLKGGAMGFIQKPYTAKELLKSVKKILSRSGKP